MRIINAQTVDEAYFRGVTDLMEYGVIQESQRGPVVVMGVPVVTVYHNPRNRVLFNPVRNANPFFHLVESVWMLAGERDARFLDRFVKTFSSRFAEENGSIHGAYGYRWRHHFDTDQLEVVGKMLYENRTTRRAVLTMWDPNFDLDVDKKDIPCNTQIFFNVRHDFVLGHDVLDMQVNNRSNDAIWGAYGANAVHMSVLHEVMAGLVGVELGVYYQNSFNFHAYTSVLDSVQPIEESVYQGEAQPILAGSTPSALRSAAKALLHGSKEFIQTQGGSDVGVPWLDQTVRPMMVAHDQWKNGHKETALTTLETVRSTDWAIAARQWFERRLK